MAIARRKRRKRLLFDRNNFPNLSSTNHHCTSDPVEQQNCIAFAAGDKIRWWWPILFGPTTSPYFWPAAAPLEETVDAFVKAFEIVKFTECKDDDDGRLEGGFEKIAIFAQNEKIRTQQSVLVPTHVAIQSPLRNGKWRSKMGDDEDIEHDLASLVGPHYGEVVVFMRRTLKQKTAARKLLQKRIASH
jgi:hypothetical protein